MFLKAFNGILYMGIGVVLVYFLQDPIVATLVGLVVITIVEVIKQKVVHK